MDVAVFDPRNVRDLSPDVMDPDSGLPRIMPASYYNDTTVAERALLGARCALYGLPTVELVLWLRQQIGGRSAIEIGAAHGALAGALGITATDSCMQSDPAINALYQAMGQKPVEYGPGVVALDAAAAVAQYKPQVVVASWVTHKWREDRAEAGGNMFGVDEEAIIDACETYIFIGNTHVHRGKSIWTSRPHKLLHRSWLFSRAHNGSPEFISVWGKFHE